MDGRAGEPVAFDFPYGSPGVNAADWKSDGRHRTEAAKQDSNAAELRRELDSDSYAVSIGWQGEARLTREGAHSFLLQPGGEEMEFVFRFSSRPAAESLPTAKETFAASAAQWQGFWNGGGAVELAGSRDPRVTELERRVVLSQYLTAIQCSGSMPPQETGLTCNSWHGKFHLEMPWWHAAHFALWGRTAMLERSLCWCSKILPSARNKAEDQGYRGARWPKMAGPDGRDSPSPIGPLLI